MSEHLSSAEIQRYHERLMTPAELLRADDHLSECAVCRTKTSESGHVNAMFADVRADLQTTPCNHLEYKQLAGFADQELDNVDREIVLSHLEICATCTDELRDLQQFK
ncbi:MAG TPA: hypothetical protein VE863_06175, partial [Pyrinomonadaceae bacterium]|nr:hypothetical protein [Pyrinomonadaceae bacterium]